MENQEPIKLIVTSENKKEFFDIYVTIRSYMDKGDNIPKAIVARLYQIMYEEGDYKFSQFLDLAGKYSSNAIERLKSMNDYQFTWLPRIVPENDFIFIPDTKQIFTELISAFFLYAEDHKDAGKDEAIAFIYWAFDDEYKTKMQLNDLEKFSSYKQAVISGIVAMAMGYKLSSKPDLSNEEIFQATRHAIRKYKNRQEL